MLIAPFGAVNLCCDMRKPRAKIAIRHMLVAMTTTISSSISSFSSCQILLVYYFLVATGNNAPEVFANHQKKVNTIREWGLCVPVQALI